MSGRTVLAIVGAAAIAAVAWWQWPRAGAPAPGPAADGGVARPTPPVRFPDAPPGAWIVGFAVVDHRGAPQPGAVVSAVPVDGPPAEVTATADPGGAVQLALGPGRWHLAVAGRALLDPREVEIGAPIDHAPLVVADAEPPPLEDLGTPDRSTGLTGVVSGGGARLPDFTVTPVFLGAVGPGHPETTTRAPHAIELAPRRFLGTSGAYRWKDLPSGSYDLFITAPGFGVGHARATALGDVWGAGSVTLTPAAALSGDVVDGRGAPVPEVTVEAAVDGRVVDRAVTDGNGIYLLSGLPAGGVAVTARIAKDVCSPSAETITVEAGKHAVHRVQLTCAWQSH